jgi:hypothetical protein
MCHALRIDPQSYASIGTTAGKEQGIDPRGRHARNRDGSPLPWAAQQRSHPAPSVARAVISIHHEQLGVTVAVACGKRRDFNSLRLKVGILRHTPEVLRIRLECVDACVDCRAAEAQSVCTIHGADVAYHADIQLAK